MRDAMNIFITGAAGFIGSSLVDRLLSAGHQVIGFDNFDSYYNPKIKRKNIENALQNPHFKLIEGDIRNKKDVEKALTDIDAIIHEAAQPGVRISVEDPIKTNDVNIIGTVTLLESARKKNIKKIVFASSSSVYGKIRYLPFAEKHPTEPISPYGASKRACEYYCAVFSKLYGITIPMLRYFTVYGPRMRPDLAINKFMHKALKNEAFEIYGDGSKTRDITYIGDVTDATMLALSYDKTDVFNIGGGNRISVKDIAQKIITITKSKSKLIFSEDIKGDVEHTECNSKKAQELLKWKPKTSVDLGLKNYYQWVLKQNV